MNLAGATLRNHAVAERRRTPQSNPSVSALSILKMLRNLLWLFIYYVKLCRMDISSLKNIFARTGTAEDPSTLETFYVRLPSQPTLFNDFFKQTGLNPKDVSGERLWTPLTGADTLMQNDERYFMFNADPEAVRKAAEATGLDFSQEFAMSLESEKIHEFSQAAGGVEFSVPPSERRSGLCPYTIRGDSQAIEKAAEQWGVDVQKKPIGTTRNENTMSFPKGHGNVS